jgi:uncharacterized protein (DUF1800 family)
MATALPSTDVAGIARPAGSLDAVSALREYTGPWNERLAAHLLRRAGFGGTAAQIQRLASRSMNAAVDGLVDFPSTEALPPPPELFDPREMLRSLLFSGQTSAKPDDMQRREIAKQVRQGERRSLIQLQNWWLNRMLNSPAPLQEKMALYFHGHFTTAAIQKGVTPQMLLDQNQLFRSNALGNLRELTWQVSIDPAMMLYLDNARSDATHPNENYARELMELFTLGVDHYTEKDVRESARAWTGWIVVRRTGKAQFVQSRHDGGSKTFLGQTGNWNGRDVVDIIYKQPACAAFWANSLLNFFVYNDPEPALVDAVAALIVKNGYDVKPVMSTLLRSNVFYSQRAYRALVKSPVEYVVGTYKALALSTIDVRAQRALVQMGQILFYPPNVAGWPGGANWLTSQTMIARQNFVASLVNSPAMDEVGWMQQVPMKAAQASAELVSTLLQDDASPAACAQLTDYLNGAGTSALGMLSGENYQERVRGAAYLTMAMPAYQLN